MNRNKTGQVLRNNIFLILATCLIYSCDPDPKIDSGRSDNFETTPARVSIQAGIIDEASGLVASAQLSGYFWTLQDSGQPASLYLISGDGKSIREFPIPGAGNHDWEDLASGAGPVAGVNYLYIGDIGNNNSPQTATNTIYRIPEIKEVNSSFDGAQLEKIRYRYPDGPRDAETILLDPATKDIFIVSKEAQTGIYRLPYPQSTTEVMNAEKVGSIPSVSTATGGSMASDGVEILIRTYLGVYYWKRKPGETVTQTLNRSETKVLSVALEPQGEAVCFDRSASGFYTFSERGNVAGVSLNYYKRK